MCRIFTGNQADTSHTYLLFVIGRHLHVKEIETVYVLAGQTVLTLGNTDHAFNAGEIVAIPAGLEHALVNTGSETVELLCIFTPPLP